MLLDGQEVSKASDKCDLTEFSSQICTKFFDLYFNFDENLSRISEL